MRIFKLIFFISFLFYLYACSNYNNKECSEYFIGKFIVDTNMVANSYFRQVIKENKWDTVTLIGSKDGRYTINTKNSILKEAEGTWSTSTDNLEELCIGHIKQKNLNTPIDQSSYTIVIKIEGKAYYLPFRKINNIP